MNSPKQNAHGGCLCGAIRYRITGEPASSMICHCQTCRRASGAPVLAWISLPLDRYEVVKGSPATFSSSPPVRRTFCSACGTQLTYSHQKEAESIDVTTCTLDDPNAFPPTHHSWLGDDLNWVKFDDGLLRFQKSRYGAG